MTRGSREDRIAKRSVSAFRRPIPSYELSLRSSSPSRSIPNADVDGHRLLVRATTGVNLDCYGIDGTSDGVLDRGSVGRWCVGSYVVGRWSSACVSKVELL